MRKQSNTRKKNPRPFRIQIINCKKTGLRKTIRHRVESKA